VGRDAVIAGGASIHGVVIGDEAYVGPGNELAKGLRLWPGAHLGATSVRFSSDA
jgi:mannose-1-phosphate guanylyltransferase